MHAARRLEGQPDAAARLRTLREAALKDAEGRALDAAERAVFTADTLTVPPR